MSLGARRRRPPTPGFVANDLWRRAGAVPSLDINPGELGHVRDLITGTTLGGGTVNSATPAWEVGPGGILAQPAANAPVVAYDPVTLRPLGLRVWQAVTNLLLRSEEFDNASWSKSSSSIVANAVAAPNGFLTADKLIEDTANATHFVAAGSTSLTAGQPYVISVYLKAAERTFASIGSVTGGIGTGINLSTGALVDVGVPGWANAATRSAAYIGNGWYRVAVTVPSATGNNSLFDSLRVFVSNGTTTSYAGNGTSGIYLWGAQLQTGSTVGPYVPTTTTTASSTAEAIDITSLPGGINNIRSVYARVRTPASGIRGIISLNDNTANNRLELLTNGTDPRAVAVTSGSTVADINGGTISANTAFRIAARFDGDNYAVSINGAPVVTDNAGARAIVDRIFLGRTQAGEYLNGYIERLATWTTPLVDARLQAIAAS